MLNLRVDLYEYFNLSRPKNANGYLNVYVLDKYEGHKDRVRPAMLVIPGGGYGSLAQREKEPIAIKFLEQGFNAFTLEYSIAPVTYPVQLLEACMAMIYIRENAKEFEIDPCRVSAIGFSAGGHLCGMLGTLYNEDIVVSTFKDRAKLARPDAVVLSYPVISSNPKICHQGSVDHLSGGDKEIIELMSLEHRVNENSVPAFIWATVDDQSVPSENSIEMAYAYKRAGVPFELHVFESGEHGLSCCDEETFMINDEVRAWLKLCFNWLKKRGFRL